MKRHFKFFINFLILYSLSTRVFAQIAAILIDATQVCGGVFAYSKSPEVSWLIY
jgi:hypothetical protein